MCVFRLDQRVRFHLFLIIRLKDKKLLKNKLIVLILITLSSYYLLLSMEYIINNSHKNLIVLVHGLTGSRKTWIEDGIKRIPDYLLENKEILSNYDIGYFEYFTKWSDRLSLIKTFIAYFNNEDAPLKKNLPIEDIKDVLYSELELATKKYEKIVIIAHSMGGIISKAAILKSIDAGNNNIAAFVSLCVPHNGSDLAQYGKIVLRSKQVKDLAPLSPIIHEVTKGWIQQSVIEFLPETLYFQGKNDIAVPKESSEGFETQKINIVYTEDDHFSILKPSNADGVIISSITETLLEALKKKALPEKQIVNTELSEQSLEELSRNISEKINQNAVGFEKNTFIKDAAPELSSHISQRTETIRSLEGSINTWLAIHGIYDTGKTQLCALIQKQITSESVWISFKEIENEFFIEKILAAFDSADDDTLSKCVSELDKRTIIALDDLPKLGSSQKHDLFFIKFIRLCAENGLKIISTSNFKIANSIKDAIGDLLTEKPIPLLSEDECLEVVASYPGSEGFPYNTIIWAITEGYPIYVQVVCRYLQANNWKIAEDNLTSFFDGSLFEDLDKETLSKFLKKVEDENIRDLLYRLNIIKSLISEKEIRLVAGCAPPIAKPFEKIIPLTGTWIQKDFNKYFLSPLFKRLGTKDVPEKVFREASYMLGQEIVSQEKITVRELRHAIAYFTDAQKMENAGFLVFNFLQYSQKYPQQYFSNELDILTWYYSEIPTSISLFLRLLIRSLHLNVVPADDFTSRDFLRKDLIDLVAKGLNEKVDVYFPSLILSMSYLKENSSLAMKYFTLYIGSHIYRKLPEIAIQGVEEVMETDKNMTWLLLMNISERKALTEWFDMAAKITLSIDSSNAEQSYLLSDKLFLNFIIRESESQEPDWKNMISTFEYAYERASLLRLDIMKALSVKSLIMVAAGKINDIQVAEDFFLKYEKSIDDEIGKSIIADELGRQFLNEGQYDKAEQYLLPVEEYELPQYIVSKPDTYLSLARIAGTTDQKKAHSYMVKAASFLHDNIFISEIIHICFTGEYAISLFLNKDLDGAMLKLIEGYDMLMNTFQKSTAYINAQLRYGNAIGYIMRIVQDGVPPIGNTFTAPYRGMMMKSNDLTDLFFDEKIHFVIFQIIEYLEMSDRSSEAKYWADKLEALANTYDIKIMQPALPTLLSYSIAEGQYSKVIQRQVSIIQSYKELSENVVVSEIENEQERELTELIKSKKTLLGQKSDFELIVFALVPIVCHLLKDLLQEKIDIAQMGNSLKGLINEHSAAFMDANTPSALLYLADNLPSNEVQARTILVYLKDLPQPAFGNLEIITYLICSLYLPPKEAAVLHFTLAAAFPLYKGGTTNSILVPFYKKFWNVRMADEPEAFKDIRKLEENLSKTSSLDIQLRLSAIFVLTADSVGYDLNQTDKAWLKDYLNEYGE